VPEARVIDLPERPVAGLDARSKAVFEKLRDTFDAVLVGPGMFDEPGTCALVQALLPMLGNPPVILDAAAMAAARQLGEVERLITPHAGEMAHLRAIALDDIDAGPAALALAADWRTTVALKGSATFIAAPGGRLMHYRGGNVGLAVSGSGDVLAGIIAALAARGATLEQAATWGVFLHARAGDRLAERRGPVGFLPREIPAEIPLLLKSLGA
jgi:hydroxyethylthiazole kinase-like uncharacterized protein yjeF